MSKLLLVFAMALFTCTACNSSSGTSTDKTSDSTVLPPASSNSDATNPSVADTAFSKKDSLSGKDTSGTVK